LALIRKLKPSIFERTDDRRTTAERCQFKIATVAGPDLDSAIVGPGPQGQGQGQGIEN
jgi:hypothetical protein